MHKLAQSVAAYIRKHDLLKAGDRLAIAVSGGADSIALLRLMLDLREELGLVLFVAHLNHQLRGADSAGDEDFVRSLAASHGLEMIAESCDVKAISSQHKLSLEAAARQARYEFFRKVVGVRVNRVATAHTLDDQAETVLLKLTRGAGTRGLSGIYPKRGTSESRNNLKLDATTIVRPLLGSRRSQLREYLAEIGQAWREDSSNQDLRHTRNRLRHEILPLLERQVNPAVCETLAESAEIARAEEDYWDKEVDRLLPEIWHCGQGRGTLKLSSQAFPLALRRRLLRAAAEKLGITLEFRHVEEILGDGCAGGELALPGNWTVTSKNDVITFARKSGLESGYHYEYALTVPGKISIAEAGISLKTSLLKEASHSHDDLVHSRFAQCKWVVRNWRPGERFWPAHTKEPKKIKELLQDRHINGDQKKLWPVIGAGDEVIWMRGFGVGRNCQSSSGEGISIRLIE